MVIDVAALRSHFPSLSGEHGGLAFFDGPGGTQTPRPVAEAVAATMTGPLSNRGTISRSELNAERAVAEQLCEGRTLAQIARLRDVSINTVKSQVRQIFRKLDVENRVGLVRRLCP
jgi:DNA-binding NarL/FixJ family response regulator